MSIFGEIQLQQSRAVSDDEDDEYSTVQENENLKRKIHWLDAEDLKEKFHVDEVILADGPISSAFIYTYLLSHFKQPNIQLLGLNATQSEYKIFKQNFDTTEEYFESTMRSNYIYLIVNPTGKKTIVCKIYDQLKQNELYDWINQLTGRYTFESSLIFCSQTSSHYLGADLEKNCFVRYLSSNKGHESQPDCMRLEAPNFIGNLPAAFIHYCVAKKIAFQTFVCYSPSLTADLQSVKEMFNVVASQLKETSPFINDESSKKSLLSVGNIVSSVSALYM